MPTDNPNLDRYTLRPATEDDLEAAVALFNLCSRALLGTPLVDTDYLANEWSAPAFELDRDTRCAFTSEGQMVAYGEVWDTAPHIVLYSWGRVHPEHRSLGLGNHLVTWQEARARQALTMAPEGARVVLRQGLRDEAKDARDLLAAHGYEAVRHYLRMVIDIDAPPLSPAWPPNLGGSRHLEVRTFNRDKDLPALIRADQDAFRDHWGFVLRPFEEELRDWGQRIDDDPHFDAELWFLAMDGDEIAGLCLCSNHVIEDPEMGWITTLGVRRPWRRRGLGLALLHHAFAELHRRGKQRVGLSVDAESLTGATRLYEKAGMHVDRVRHTYQKELRAGEDFTTQASTQSEVT